MRRSLAHSIVFALWQRRPWAALPSRTPRRASRPSVRCLVGLLTITVFLTTALGAPQASTQEPTFRSAASDLVVLPVAVTDGKGRFVPSLRENAFAVYDEGRPQPLAFFSNEDAPVSVGLVIDASTSMAPKMGEVVAAAVAFATSSNPQDELFALAFNDTVHEALEGRRVLLASDVVDLEHAVASLRAEGQTALYDALLAGLDRLDQGTRARKVLIVVSDGGDNASRATLKQVLDRARRSDAAVYTIGVFDPEDRDSNPGVLQALADATGGERFLPASAGPLLQACRRIAYEIRSSYTVAYELPEHDHRYHGVRVSVAAPGHDRLHAHTRPGYFAEDRP